MTYPIRTKVKFLQVRTTWLKFGVVDSVKSLAGPTLKAHFEWAAMQIGYL